MFNAALLATIANLNGFHTPKVMYIRVKNCIVTNVVTYIFEIIISIFINLPIYKNFAVERVKAHKLINLIFVDISSKALILKKFKI